MAVEKMANNSSEAFAGTISQAFDALNGVKGYKGDVTITGEVTLEQLTKLNKATTGAITLSDPVDFVGTSTEILTAIAGDINSTGNIVITNNNYTLAQLNAISEAGTIELSNASVALSGSVGDLNVLSGIFNYAGAITVTGKYDLAQLRIIDTYTTGKINVANKSVTLSGNADELAAMLPNLAGYKGAVTVLDAPTVAQLKAINNATAGSITLKDQSGDLSGSAADILAAFKGIKSYEGAIEVTGTDYKLADLKAINAITTDGAFTVDSPIALTGSAKDLAAALKGVTYAEDVTVTGSYTVAELKAINVAADNVTLTSKNVALTGSIADITDALDGITGYTGAIKLTDSSITATELAEINALTTGKITLPANGHADLAGTVSEVTAALQGVTGYKGTVTVTVDGTTTLAKLQTILKSTVVKADFDASGGATTVNTTLKGTAKEITAVLNKFKTEYIGKLTVTGSYTLADLVALNKLLPTDTGADVTLDNTINLSGKSADIAAALSNVTGYAGKITLTDKPTLVQLVAINNATTEPIKIPTDTALSGTTAEVKAALVGIEGHKGNVNLTNPASAADLNTIAGLTTGVVKATLAADTTINDVTVTTTLANVKTSDVITLNSTVATADATALIALNALVDTKSYAALTKITEVSTTENLVTVITNALAIKPNVAVEITGPISAADLNTIAGLTTGVVTATLAPTTPITDATVIALANVDANDVISLTSTVTSADATALVALAAKVSTADATAFSSVTTITEVAGQVGSNGQNVVDALNIAGNDAAATITGAISAAQLDAIAVKTSGVVTATLAANTAITDATVIALGNVDTNDVISLTSSVTSADATALVALAGKVSTADATAFNSVATITEAFDTATLTTVIANALAITGVDNTQNTNVQITGGTITKTAFDLIDANTAGSIDVSGITLAADDATDFSLVDLASVTGLLTLNTVDSNGGDAVNHITGSGAGGAITAADILALTGTTLTGGADTIALTITGDVADTINLTGWNFVSGTQGKAGVYSHADGADTYNITVVGSENVLGSI